MPTGMGREGVKSLRGAQYRKRSKCRMTDILSQGVNTWAPVNNHQPPHIPTLGGKLLASFFFVFKLA